ncbi:speriolin [Alligator mississippiensis]|uniref:speriolin n=1 Tax=Alligator mississippiensis TaxID=8496 RepID=UPI002877414C|nr:speriolin [Alligator mississippiensis]
MSAAPGQAAQLQTVPAVLRHYEQLRRAIDALLQENDALKKVAALLRENRQIRNYLQTHAHGDLSAISNFIPLAASTVPNASGIVPGLAPNVVLNDGQGSGSWNTTLSDATLGLVRGGLINSGETLTSAVNQQSQQMGAGSQLASSRGQSSQAHSRGAEPVVRTSTPPTQVFTFGPAELSGFPDVTYPDTVFQSANIMENILNNTSALGAAAPRPGAAPTSGSVLGSTPIIGAGLVAPPGAVGGAIALPGPSLAQATARPLADTQRPPDVRPKERTHRVPRTTERPMSVRDSIQPGLGPRDPKRQTWERIVGEIAFQLDRRILSSIFPDRVRLYGFTVNNIPEKIMKSISNGTTWHVDEVQCAAMAQRYTALMQRLSRMGYDPRMHPAFTEHVVNSYGILRERPELSSAEGRSYNNVDFLRGVVVDTVPEEARRDALLLLDCLYELSKDDGKPLFIW